MGEEFKCGPSADASPQCRLAGGSALGPAERREITGTQRPASAAEPTSSVKTHIRGGVL